MRLNLGVLVYYVPTLGFIVGFTMLVISLGRQGAVPMWAAALLALGAVLAALETVVISNAYFIAASAVLLALVLHLLRWLRVRVFWGLGNVVVVVEHGHGSLHLCRRGVAHAVHVLRSHLGVCWQLLLRLL